MERSSREVTGNDKVLLKGLRVEDGLDKLGEDAAIDRAFHVTAINCIAKQGANRRECSYWVLLDVKMR